MKPWSVQAGELSRVVDILRKAETDDGYGGKVLSLEMVAAKVRAGIRPISAREREYGRQLALNTTHRVVMRFRTIDTSWIIRDGTTFYAIHGKVDVGLQGRKLELDCSEGIPEVDASALNKSLAGASGIGSASAFGLGGVLQS